MYLDQFWIAIISKFLTEELKIAMIFFQGGGSHSLDCLGGGGKGVGGGEGCFRLNWPSIGIKLNC